MRGAALSMLLAGCLAPDLDVTGKGCSSDDPCPAPWVCRSSDHTCRRADDVATPVFARGLLVAAATTLQIVPHPLGTTPSALWLWTVGAPTNDHGDGSKLGIGLSDGSVSRALGTSDFDASGATLANSELDDAALVWLNHDGTVAARASLEGWDADTFTLRWTVQPPAGAMVHWALVGGNGVRAAVLDWGLPAHVSGLGFAPSVVVSVGTAAVAGTQRNQREHVGGLSLSMATANAQWALGTSRTDASSSGFPSAHQQRLDVALLQVSPGAGVPATQLEATAALESDGFSLTPSMTVSPASSVRGFSLALGGVAAAAGSVHKPSGSSSPQQLAVGFRPGLVFAAGTQDVETAARSDALFGFGAADARGASAIATRAQTGTLFTSHYQNEAAAYAVLDRGDQVKSIAGTVEFNDAGFSWVWSPNATDSIDVLYGVLGAP